MSTAVTLVGGRQVICVQRPLVVGIHVEGTIASLTARTTPKLIPRPYLNYLAETLYRLHCPVVLFTSTDPRSDTALWSRFVAQDFRVPFEKVYDPDAHACNGCRRARGLAGCDFTPHLTQLAARVGTPPSRVLFLDCELNYRFRPAQTLVLEKYDFLTWRQERQRWALASLVNGNNTPGGRARQAREAYEQRLRATVAHVERQTQGLVAEQAFAARKGKVLVDHIGLHSNVLQRRAESIVQEQRHTLRASLAGKAPIAMGSVEFVQAKDALQTTTTSHPLTAQTAAAAPPVLRRHDRSLVAVAEMIARLAADESSVTEFLHTQPLVEQLRVPNFDNTAYYLSSERCEHLVPFDWSTIEVEEAERAADEAAA